ncbi:hypothetical protein JMJ78_0008157 [Colletotrichum scovillei]|nr:hypothetical protein JMJ78_0008157 [Colletotrichum scovillei]
MTSSWTAHAQIRRAVPYDFQSLIAAQL